jgi:hypothetical protein
MLKAANDGTGQSNMLSLPTTATGDASAGSYYCPVCLRRIGAAEAHRRAHRERCPSGPLDALLVRCPTCGVVLAAEVGPPAILPALDAVA